MVKKKVLITGAGSGLGKSAAIELARRGHTVYATTQYDNQVEPLKEIAIKENILLKPFKLDVLIEEDRKLILDYDIDVLIVNSAIGDSGSVSEIDISRIEKVFNTNIFGNLKLVQLALTKMIKINKKGRIIFLSSLAGRISIPFLSPYCASKFALEAFATSLKEEMKLLPDTKIEIGIIEPGAYATGFNKENYEKKYKWMRENSYFIKIVDNLEKYETKIWNFIEVKSFKSIVKKYVKVVEKKKIKTRYTAKWWQSAFVQLARICGM